MSKQPLRVTLVSLFPESVGGVFSSSILGRAQTSGTLVVEEVQIRDFATDKHRTVDDTPSGGGPGMIMRVDVVGRAIEAAVERGGDAKTRTILLDAAGDRFTNADAERLAGYEHLVLVCGRYEGVDARVHTRVDEVLTIGDFVLTGGELAAAVVVDAVARHVPGVLGNAASAEEESHKRGLLEHRQYTRPTEDAGLAIPEVLTSGDHKKIEQARRKDALLRTRQQRPDLFAAYELSSKDEALLVDDRVPSLSPAQKETS